jgi:hypothetical protein
MTYDVGNSGPGLRQVQTQKCVSVKQVNGIRTQGLSVHLSGPRRANKGPMNLKDPIALAIDLLF